MNGARLSLVRERVLWSQVGVSPGLRNLEDTLSTFLGLPSLKTQFLLSDLLPKVFL